jgi:hypothetical protein
VSRTVINKGAGAMLKEVEVLPVKLGVRGVIMPVAVPT